MYHNEYASKPRKIFLGFDVFYGKVPRWEHLWLLNKEQGAYEYRNAILHLLDSLLPLCGAKLRCHGKKRILLSLSYFVSSEALRTSRYSFSLTAIATGMAAFSNSPRAPTGLSESVSPPWSPAVRCGFLLRCFFSTLSCVATFLSLLKCAVHPMHWCGEGVTDLFQYSRVHWGMHEKYKRHS